MLPAFLIQKYVFLLTDYLYLDDAFENRPNPGSGIKFFAFDILVLEYVICIMCMDY